MRTLINCPIKNRVKFLLKIFQKNSLFNNKEGITIIYHNYSNFISKSAYVSSTKF